MRFKSNKQRKAVMAKLKAQGKMPIMMPNGEIIGRRIKAEQMGNFQMNIVRIDNKDYLLGSGAEYLQGYDKIYDFKDLKRLNYKKDTDGDGVPDHKDCAPNDPDRQGFMHDWKMKRLKATEEKLESRRQKLQNKLEDQREELEAKARINKSKMAQKQAVIDEVNKEKDAIKKMKDANRRMEAELEKSSLKGKVKRGVTGAIVGARKFAQDPKTKKAMSSIKKQIFG